MWKNSKVFFDWCNKNSFLLHICQVEIKSLPVLLLDNARGGFFGCRIILANKTEKKHDDLLKHYSKRGYYCTIENSYKNCRSVLMWYLRFSPTKSTQNKLTPTENKVYRLFKIHNRPIYSGDINALAEQNDFTVKNSFAILHRLAQKKFIRKVENVDDGSVNTDHHPDGRGRTPSVFYEDCYPDNKS